MDIWPWICDLPNSEHWAESNSPLVYQFASSKQISHGNSTKSIELRAERTFGSNDDPFLIFSVCLNGFRSFGSSTPLWVSDMCALSSDKPFLPLLLQLLQEIISRSPTSPDTTCPRSQLQKLKPEPISWVMDTHSPESFSSFFNLVFLTRLFWLCVCNAPSEVGSFYFQSLLSPNLESLPFECSNVLRTFLMTVGVDAEQCLMRAIGYMVSKWLILREVGVGLQTLTSPASSKNLGFSYATEAHGYWLLKGYAPVPGMRLAGAKAPRYQFPLMDAKDSALKYALAHQQLEAVMQFEYSVGFYEGYIHVSARVDNFRFHVARLGFNKDEEGEYAEERHFVSRVRVWVGPEVGATYVAGLSLGRSTDNREREMKIHRTMKGRYGKSKLPMVKLAARMSTRTRIKNWRWDQEAEGNAAVFDAVLCDTTTGNEVATWKLASGGDGDQKRCGGANRPYTKKGGVVFAGDEYGEEIGWRLSREMEGNVLKWRIGGKIWLSYWPTEVKSSSCFETRCVEWCDEVDLPLFPLKFSL